MCPMHLIHWMTGTGMASMTAMTDTNTAKSSQDQTVPLGTAGPRIFPLALGCMGMGAGSFYGDGDETEGIATIHAALDRGVNLIDTGDFYATGKNELLVGKALAGGW